MRVRSFTAVLGCALVLAGCEGAGRNDANVKPIEKYVAPQAPATDLATLKGTWGAFVEQVDDHMVKEVKFQLTGLGVGLGGDQTLVEPGERKILLYVSEDRGYFRKQFSFTFEKGHVYELSRAMNLFAQNVKIHDATTKQDYFIK